MGESIAAYVCIRTGCNLVHRIELLR